MHRRRVLPGRSGDRRGGRRGYRGGDAAHRVSGRLCQISNSRRASYGYDQRIEAHGAKGLLRAGNVTATTVELANAAGFVSDPALPFFLERYAAAYRAELDAFIAAVTLGAAPLPNGDDGLRALLLADAATEFGAHRRHHPSGVKERRPCVSAW